MGINAGSGKGALAYSLEFKGGTSTTVEFNDEDVYKRQVHLYGMNIAGADFTDACRTGNNFFSNEMCIRDSSQNLCHH